MPLIYILAHYITATWFIKSLK